MKIDPERADRLKRIYVEIDTITRDIGPKLIRLSHLREEARQIIGQLDEKRD